jgi:hypothetical protein
MMTNSFVMEDGEVFWMVIDDVLSPKKDTIPHTATPLNGLNNLLSTNMPMALQTVRRIYFNEN